MDQNKQRIQQGLFPSFPSGFTGLSANSAASNAFMSTLQQLSSLSTPILPGTTPLTPSDLTQWAAQQQAAQGWIDQAKVAAMLPVYGMFAGVKGLDLSGNDLLAKAAAAATSNQAAVQQQALFAQAMTSGVTSDALNSRQQITVDDSPPGPSGENPPSTDTDSNHEIDVGGIEGSMPIMGNHDASRKGSMISVGGYQQNHYTCPIIIGSTQSSLPSSISAVHVPVASMSSVYATSSGVPSSMTIGAVNHRMTPVPTQASELHMPTPSAIQPRRLSKTFDSPSTSRDPPPAVVTSFASNGVIASAKTAEDVQTPQAQPDDWSNLELTDLHEFFPGTGTAAKLKGFENMKRTLEVETSSGQQAKRQRPKQSPHGFSIANLARGEGHSATTHVELADADKELERLLSIVEERNKQKTPHQLQPNLSIFAPSTSSVISSNISMAPSASTIVSTGGSSIFSTNGLTVSTMNEASQNRLSGPLTSTSSSLTTSHSKEKEKDKDLGFEWDIKDTAPNPSLSPVQFTPPDSPTGLGSFDLFLTPSTSSNMTTTSIGAQNASRVPSTSGPSTSSLLPEKHPESLASLTEIPKKITPKKVKKESSLFARARRPVYKQKSSFKSLASEEADTKPGSKDDAYMFTDEEDEIIAISEPKDKLSEEVQQRLAKADGRKNVYVPGVGFAVPKEEQADLWRHVVPKKRFAAMAGERGSIPANALLPPGTQVDPTTAAALAAPEILTLSESIHMRKNERKRHTFCQAECSTEKNTAKDEGFSHVVERTTSLGGSMPKLLLRIPKKLLQEGISNNENYERPRHHHHHKEKKKKKKKKKDRDTEWAGSDRAKRKKSRRSSRRSEVSKSSESEEDREEQENKDVVVKQEPVETPVEPPPVDMSMLSKKRRLMLQWQEDEKAQQHVRNGATERIVEQKITDFNSDFVKKRLNKFGPADGQLPKGTFVVCKADLFKDDCALWRVDNQNLLQKYPPRVDPETKCISYRNSSTYSGWCDQIASGYLTVKIRYIKQTRSEAVIEPEVPLIDLFPAVTGEVVDTNELSYDEKAKAHKAVPPSSDEINFLLRDPMRLTLYTYCTAMLHHVLTLDFFQEVKERNDWNYLRAMTEVDRNNSECIEKLRERVKFSDKLDDLMYNYTSIMIESVDLGDVLCQVCGVRKVEKSFLLFGLDMYDRESLQNTDNPYPGDSPLPAVEVLGCAQCSSICQLYHSAVHMRYHMLKKCEDKLESFGAQFPDLPPEKIVEKAKESSQWMTKVVKEYADLWKKLQGNDF